MMHRIFAGLVLYALLTTVALAQIGGLAFPGPGPKQTAGGGGFSLTVGNNVGSATTGAAATTYAGVAWGSGCNSAIFLHWWYNTATTDTVPTFAVSGNSNASQVVLTNSGTSGGQSVGIWQLNSPVGTSATITVTHSANVTYNSNVTVYCLVSGTTAATSTGSTPGAACNNVVPISGIVTTPTGGNSVIAASDDSGQVISLTNATADTGSPYTGGSVQDVWGRTTASGIATVSATPAAGDTCSLAWASYGP